MFITALGNIASRRRCAELIEKRGGTFISVIHRSASLGQNVTVDPGSFIAHNVVLTVDIAVGRHADIFHGTEIGHDSTVGDFANRAPGVSLSGHSKIGQDVFMGTNSCTAPGMTVGDGATVACGTPVLKDVAPGTTLSPFGTLKA